MKKNRKIKWVFLVAAAAFLGSGLYCGLTVKHYTLATSKLTRPVRLVFLSDLHACWYGENQKNLLRVVREQNPDGILLGGDWVDDDFNALPPEAAYLAARALAKLCPVFYVTGNHEVWSGQDDQIKQKMTECGVMVLSGTLAELTIGDQSIQICGLDDWAVGEKIWRQELESLRNEIASAPKTYHVLLTHRPEHIEDYNGFDLALAGHAHGGQWRIPFLLNGLLAPNQGLFPKYAGGMYTKPDGKILIVGRGLARESTRVPRFFNPPEVVVLEINPLES